MAKAKRGARGSRDYLFQRQGSPNWYVKLRSPDGRKEVSLGTTDKTQAAIIAGPMILDHKAKLYAMRPRLEMVPYTLEPGEHTGPNGERIIATERDLIYFDAANKLLRTEPNAPAQRVVNMPMGAVIVGENPLRPLSELRRIGPVIDLSKLERSKPPAKTGDDALLETYLTHNGINGIREKQARDIWHLFRSVVKKPIAKCTRDDGRAIVAHLEAEGCTKSATLRRRMVPLIATVNLAIDEGKLTFNPFAGCIPVRDDEEERDAFSDDDMKRIRANLHKLSKEDQLLVRLLATTGVRRGEAFEIDREETEGGIRFVTIGSKTPQSLRRVPFPKDLLPHLPEKITGQLIPGRMDTAGKRLSAWLADIGVIKDDDERDLAPMHSFRHRAAKRMRAAGIPEDVREAVGGWANGKKKKPSRKYGNKHGAGYPLKMLKKAIDCIGF